MPKFDERRNEIFEELIELPGHEGSTWQMHAAADLISGLRAVHAELQAIHREIDDLRGEVRDLASAVAEDAPASPAKKTASKRRR